MVREREPAWQDEILAAIPSGIDGAQVDAFLKLSPTERLEQMRQVLVQLEEARGPKWSPISAR